MIYLNHFEFPENDVYDFLSEKRTCFDSYYPYQILSRHDLKMLDFENITILYGGNGSGKTTVLNVIAETLKLNRDTLYNRSTFFEAYTKECQYELYNPLPPESSIITSDDVFDYMLNLRKLNQHVDVERENLFEEYQQMKHMDFQIHSLDDYEQLKKMNLARKTTQSNYVRKGMPGNLREHSNGESALKYFTEKIKDGGLYLLDEPENSLSPQKQQELVQFLEDSARFFNCQFVIATHSPFVLALKGAKIYDLDADPVDVKTWTQLENVRVYFEFFKQHKEEFY